MRITLLTIAALAASLFSAPLGATAQTEPASTTLRIVHAAAGAPGVDVYLDGQLALESRDFFSEASIALTPGDHEVLVVGEGQAASPALVGKRIDPDRGDTYTLVLIGAGENVSGLLLKDRSSAPEPDEARVRIVHAADGVGPIDLAVAGGEPFLQDAILGSATYVDVAPGDYAFDLTSSATGAELLQTLNLSFTPGWAYTLVVTGDSPESIWVQAIVDRTGS
jgi:hypothetical protein